MPDVVGLRVDVRDLDEQLIRAIAVRDDGVANHNARRGFARIDGHESVPLLLDSEGCIPVGAVAVRFSCGAWKASLLPQAGGPARVQA